MRIPNFISSHAIPLAIIFATFGVYFFTLFPRMIELRPTGLYLGHEHVWSDWPLHIGMIHNFATRSPENWFAHHPMYAHGKFTYSFLTNLISATFMRVGFPLTLSIIIPSLIFVTALLIGLYTFSFKLFKSKSIAVLAIFLFFLSSGPGFIEYFNDVLTSPDAETILYPQKHYSRINDYSWYAGNFIVGMLIPQRAYLLGMTIGVWILIGLITALQNSTPNRRTKTLLIVSGIAAGLLTIAHVHSFIAIVVITGSVCLINFRRWQLLLYYVLPSAIISITLYQIFIAGGIESKQFIQFLPGYASKGNIVDWFVMWYRLWGLMIPAAIAGFLLLKPKETTAKGLFAGFFILFAIANFVLFQPVEWDNAKFFGWVYLGFSVLAALFLHTMFTLGGRFKYLTKTISVIIFLFLTLTGMTELLRLQYVERNAFMGVSSADIQLGTQVREQTPETAVFLTAPSTNHWVMTWAARPIMMGFVGWVHNFGFIYDQRLADMHTIYAGGDQVLPLIQKYQISYVVIGTGELNDFKANEPYFKDNFSLRFQNQSNRVYDVSQTMEETPITR